MDLETEENDSETRYRVQTKFIAKAEKRESCWIALRTIS